MDVVNRRDIDNREDTRVLAEVLGGLEAGFFIFDKVVVLCNICVV